eukprot:3379420-Amphidinium_carterae.1
MKRVRISSGGGRAQRTCAGWPGEWISVRSFGRSNGWLIKNAGGSRRDWTRLGQAGVAGGHAWCDT